MCKRLLLAVAAVALAAAGCTTSATGQPTPATDDSSTSSAPQTSESSGSATPTVEVPPRPRDISLEGLDPCTLFTEEQRAQLQANDVESGEVGEDAEFYKGMKECVLYVDDQEPFYEYNAMAVTFEGVEQWLTGKRNAEAELTSVQGFPAVKLKFPNTDGEGCTYAIGVADQQHLMVEMMRMSRGFTQEQICQMSEEAANMAITTLQTLR